MKAGRNFCALCVLFLGACAPAAPRVVVETVLPPPAPTAPAVITRIVTLAPAEAAPPADLTPSATPEPDPRLKKLLALPSIPLTVRGDGFVNLRGGPGSLYDIVGRVQTGTMVDALAVSEHGEWLLLRHPTDPNQVAWVYGAYTDYDPTLHKLPNIVDLP